MTNSSIVAIKRRSILSPKCCSWADWRCWVCPSSEKNSKCGRYIPKRLWPSQCAPSSWTRCRAISACSVLRWPSCFSSATCISSTWTNANTFSTWTAPWTTACRYSKCMMHSTWSYSRAIAWASRWWRWQCRRTPPPTLATRIVIRKVVWLTHRPRTTCLCSRWARTAS